MSQDIKAICQGLLTNPVYQRLIESFMSLYNNLLTQLIHAKDINDIRFIQGQLNILKMLLDASQPQDLPSAPSTQWGTVASTVPPLIKSGGNPTGDG